MGIYEITVKLYAGKGIETRYPSELDSSKGPLITAKTYCIESEFYCDSIEYAKEIFIKEHKQKILKNTDKIDELL